MNNVPLLPLDKIKTLRFTYPSSKIYILMVEATLKYSHGHSSFKEIGKQYGRSSNRIRQWLFKFGRIMMTIARKSGWHQEEIDSLYIENSKIVKNIFWQELSKSYIEFINTYRENEIKPKINIVDALLKVKSICSDLNIGERVFTIDYSTCTPVILEGYVLAIGIESIFQQDELI
jgi:hypothetical protein